MGIGILAGLIAAKLQRGHSLGCLVNMIVGLIGGGLGGWLISLVGFEPGTGLVPQLITAVIGAVVFLWLVGLIFGRRK